MRAKEFINETASAGASGAGSVATVSMPMGSIQKRKKRVGEDSDDDLLQTGSNLGGSKDNFAVVDTKVGGWKRAYPDKESAEAWASAWNRKYGHKEPVKVVPITKPTNEDYNNEMIEVVFNNENAMELAYSKFDFDWQGDMMFIEEKYIGQLEDLLFSHGFDEGEDFEIDPQDPSAPGYYDNEDEFSDDDIPPHAWSSSTAGKR